MDVWKLVDQEVQQAFDNGKVLSADRATLDRWLVSLTGRTYEFERDQPPMERRLEVLRHLTAVKLAEESDKAQRKHNIATRWIAVAGIIITAVAAILTASRPLSLSYLRPLRRNQHPLRHPHQRQTRRVCGLVWHGRDVGKYGSVLTINTNCSFDLGPGDAALVANSIRGRDLPLDEPRRSA
jgi:hypothetical protein